jgi:hypothetical protein
MLVHANVQPASRTDDPIPHAAEIVRADLCTIGTLGYLPDVAGTYTLDADPADGPTGIRAFKLVMPQSGGDEVRPRFSLQIQVLRIVSEWSIVLATGVTTLTSDNVEEIIGVEDYVFPSGQGDLVAIFVPGMETDQSRDNGASRLESASRVVGTGGPPATGFDAREERIVWRITLVSDTGLSPYVAAVAPADIGEPGADCCSPIGKK